MQGGELQAQLLAHRPVASGPTPWANTWIIVPHRGAARAVQQALQPLGPGRLPHILTLQDPDVFAAALGLPLPPLANSWPVRAQALRLLREAHPALKPEALIPRTEGLLQSLNLLAEYGISPAALAASVPPELAEAWGFHGMVLLQLWQAVQPAAATLLPAGRRRAVWHAVAAAAPAQRPASVLWWAPPAATPVLEALCQALQPQLLPVHSAQPSPCTNLVAAQPWDEVQRLTLWVATQLQQGAQRVAVVASDPLAGRLATELRVRLGVRATTTGGTRWGETAVGQQLLQAAARWAGNEKELSLDYWLNQLPLLALPPALQQLLEALRALPFRYPGSVALAWLRQALAALAGHAEDALQPDPRVHILPAHVATQQPWEALAVASLVEGVWPTAADSGGLSQAQRRALGLPDATQQAAHAQALLQQLQRQGVGTVLLSRSAHDEGGNPLLPSRWWPAAVPAVAEAFHPAGWVRPAPAARLGVFAPPAPPDRLSPSLLEAVLACPYRAYAERVLKLQPLPPLVPIPDSRTRGTVLHRWLAAALQQHSEPAAVGVAALTERLKASAATFLADCTPLERALWWPKMRNLAPAVAAAWVASGAQWRVESTLSLILNNSGLNTLTLTAQADALATTAAGTTVLDYKTGAPPSKAAVQRGEKPQLALEAWLLQQQGEPLAGLAYWHLKGFGETPLPVVNIPADDATLSLVAPTLAAVQGAYFQPHAAWPAVPDAVGAGVVASGACDHCALAGVCRRSAWAQQPTGQESAAA
ncbi:MAG: PD-(D/E)XK nuclease family protein [Alphaproteobacteria bacterium]|nr:PD-(D/E)XK nuclease family protein [Alphaproteobacteria bacterium]